MVSKVEHNGCGEDDNIVEVTMQSLLERCCTTQDLLVRTELNARGEGDQHVARDGNLENGVM